MNGNKIKDLTQHLVDPHTHTSEMPSDMERKKELHNHAFRWRGKSAVKHLKATDCESLCADLHLLQKRSTFRSLDGAKELRILIMHLIISDV